MRPKTFAEYSSYANELISTHIGGLKLRAIKLQQVNDFYATLADEGRPVHVIRYIHRVFHVLLEDAIGLGFIPHNPAHYADLPTAEEAADKMQIFSTSEYQCFIDACSISQHCTLYKLGIKTGMRQGEMFGLTWKNVDFHRAEIRINRQISRFGKDDQRFCFASPKTKNSRRTISIGPDLVEMLKTHRQAQQAQKQFMGIKWQEKKRSGVHHIYWDPVGSSQHDARF